MAYTYEELLKMGAKPVTTPVKATSPEPKKEKSYTYEELQSMGATPVKEQTTGGKILRSIAKIPVQVGLSVAAPFAGKDGVTVKSKYLGDTSDYLTEARGKIDNLSNKVNSGEISKGRGVVGVLGAAAKPALDLATFVPGGKLATETVKGVAKGAVKQTAKDAFVTSLKRGGGFSAGYDVADQAASGEKYNPLQTIKTAAIGTVADFGLSYGLPKAISAIPKPISKNEKIILGREKELKAIEGNYANTRKANQFSKDAGTASRRRVAETDVLADAVDAEGNIRTKQKGGAVDQYKAQTLDEAEGVVRNMLKNEGATVDLKTVEQQLLRTVRESGLEGSDLVTALNGIKKEIAGYRLKAGKTGSVPLTLIHDAKISITKGINYMTAPEVKAYRKAIARGLKETVENVSKTNVKEVNGELAKYLDDIAFLERLDGKKVKGGRLGKYFSQISGNVIGGLTGGAIGGPAGSAIGSIAGGELGGRIRGSMLQKTLGGKTGGVAPKSKILEKAVESSKITPPWMK